MTQTDEEYFIAPNNNGLQYDRAVERDATVIPEVSVWALLFGPERRILVSQRIRSKSAPHEFQTPGGKLEGFERPIDAIDREVSEECGIMGLTFETVAFVANVVKPGVRKHSVCLWFAAFVPRSWWDVTLPIESGPEGPKSGPWEWVTDQELCARPVLIGTREALGAWVRQNRFSIQHFVKR